MTERSPGISAFIDDGLIFVHNYSSLTPAHTGAELAGLGELGKPWPCSLALKIDQLPDGLSPKNVVATASVLLKRQPLQRAAQVIEVDVRIRLALQNPKAQLLMLAHKT